MKQLRLYLDTSVFGGYFDEEFLEFTRPLFDRIRLREFGIFYSVLTQQELEAAPKNVKNLVLDLEEENTYFIEETEEAIELASSYIAENVVGESSFADCLHIALATINQADVLVSWNFKHIVNIERIRGYNSVNIRNGYRSLDIRSPRELMNYGS